MRITKQQQQAIARVYHRRQMDISFLTFRRSIQPTFGMDGAIVVQWCNMWLAIEKDGYTHS